MPNTMKVTKQFEEWNHDNIPPTKIQITFFEEGGVQFENVENGYHVNLHARQFRRIADKFTQTMEEEIQRREQESFMNPDPVHCDDKDWWFYDETFAHRYGPYGSEKEARNQLKIYIESLG